MKKGLTILLYFFVVVNVPLFGSLSVTSVTPSSGNSSEGETVTINGSGFTQVVDVYFGSVKSKSFQISSDNTLTAIVPTPAGPSGLVHVSVSDGTNKSPVSPQN